jgi:integral membrane protein
MDRLINSPLGWLRITAFVEGLSFLILLFIAMPFKYFLGMPEMVRIVGMAHGLLFMLYIILVIYVKLKLKWSLFKTGIALFASIIPFGTFWAEYRIFRINTR